MEATVLAYWKWSNTGDHEDWIQYWNVVTHRRRLRLLTDREWQLLQQYFESQISWWLCPECVSVRHVCVSVSGFKRCVHSKIVYCVILVYCRSGNFTIKIFRQLLRRQKFLTCSFNFRHLATQRKLNARTFLMRKKKLHKISWSTVQEC